MMAAAQAERIYTDEDVFTRDAALILEVPADASGPPRRIANLTGVPSDWSDDHRLLFFRPEQGTVALAMYQESNGDLRSVGPGSEAQFSSMRLRSRSRS